MNFKLANNLPILTALKQFFPQNSKNSLRKWIQEGRISVDGTPIYLTNSIAHQGQTISIHSRKKFIRDTLPILYEDKDLVVVNKPSGLLSVAAAFENQETTLAILKNHYKNRQVQAVHRLDQDTSGVLVFSLHAFVHDKLKELFAKHDIERLYIAIVEGNLQPTSGVWKSYQYEDSAYHVHDTQDSTKGRLAITHYKVKGFSKYYTCVECSLETGRKNQIRVHCKSSGHSVVGDKKYGAKTNPLQRLCLHAHTLAFKHPVSGKQMRFTAPIPESFYSLVPLQLQN